MTVEVDVRDEVDSAARLGRRGHGVRRMFVVYGIVYSFGAFFDSMAEDFGTGKGATALMFSITTAGYFGLGLFSGKAADRFGPRPLHARRRRRCSAPACWRRRGSSRSGSATSPTASASVIAVACAYVPMVATVGGWFVQRRTTALGVAVAGIGVGTLVLAPLSERLIDAYGWRTAYVVLGIGGAAAAAARQPRCAAAARRPRPGAGAAAADRRATAASSSCTSRASCCRSALFVPFVFIKSYATDEGIDAGPAAALVGIIGASSVVGRLGLGGARQPPRRHPADAAELRHDGRQLR